MNENIYKKLNNYFSDKLEFAVYRESTKKEEGAVWNVQNTFKSISYLKYNNFQGNHIFLRPEKNHEDYYVLCDDLDRETLQKDHKENGSFKLGRLVVETSPNNFQVWIKSDRPLEKHEKNHYLKRYDSDPGCSPLHRWGRCPGFRNRKEKYKDLNYPLSKLIWVDWKYSESFPKIEKPKKLDNPKINYSSQKYSKSEITRSMYPGQSESETDFRYTLALIRRGYSDQEIFERISEERTNWEKKPSQTQREKYLTRTVKNAREIIQS